MNDLASLRTLRSQCAYKEDVDVRRGEKITGGNGKALYRAEFITTDVIKRKDTPIVLLEMIGNDAVLEIYHYITLSH
ncbi:unnamed protein product, partial [Adineta steineri]